MKNNTIASTGYSGKRYPGVVTTFRCSVFLTSAHRSLILILLSFLCAVSTSHAQEDRPCPTLQPDSESSTELLVKGTLQYHQWTIDVLEAVTASVSSRLEQPLGSSEKSVTVYFDVVKGGQIGDLEVHETSGDRVFDDEFLQAIQFLAPFSIDSTYMDECSLQKLALSIKWVNGGSLTEIRDTE